MQFHEPTNLIDLQVNGYGGVDFNQDELTGEELERACTAMRHDGVDWFLLTLITEHHDRLQLRLKNAIAARDCSSMARQMMAGIHLEGPFLSALPGYVGAHPADAVMPADVELMKRFMESANGLIKLVTLAPEADADQRLTKWLHSQGIKISAGHCNPTIDQLRASIDSGLTMFTHLGNACPANLPRHDNVVQRALSLSDQLRISFIADGMHIPWFALKNYLDIAGLERSFIVSDAIAPAGLGPGNYTLGRWELEIGEDMAARSPDGSHMVGSAQPLKFAWLKLQSEMGLTADQASRLTGQNAANALESLMSG